MKFSTTLSLTLFFVLTSTVVARPGHSANSQRNGRRAVRSTSILNSQSSHPSRKVTNLLTLLKILTRNRISLVSRKRRPPLPPSISISTIFKEIYCKAANHSIRVFHLTLSTRVGMKKKKELFFFFGITDAATFKKKLATDIHPLITSTTALLDVATQPVTALNIAFSHSGLQTLGITDNLGDDAFAQGQAADALNLLDPGTGNWVPGFVGTSVHGVFLLASDTIDNVNDLLDDLQASLGSAITELHRLQGAARPGDQEGHERKLPFS